MALGPGPRSRLSTPKERNEPSTSSCSLLARKGYHGLCRRLIIWIRQGAVTSSRRWLHKVYSLCFKIFDFHRTKIFPDRKGSAGNYMGMRKVCRLHPRKRVKNRNIPQSANTTVGVKMSSRPASQDSKIPDATYALFKPNSHVPGKDLTTADTLSRVPLHRSLTKEETKFNEELYLYVSHVIESLPAAERRLQEVRPHQDEDEICLTCFNNSTERVGRRNIK